PNGEVTIEFETPEGYTPTTPNTGDDTSDSDGTKVTITVDGKDNPTIDSGFVKNPTKLELGDTVWFDTDHDGIQDAGEKGIEGVTVVLVKADGIMIKTTTDANGHYIFKDLEPGKYTIYFETPAGMIPTDVNAGDDTLDSDGSVVTIDLTSNDYTIDSGFYTPEGGSGIPTNPATPVDPGTPTNPATPVEPGIPTNPATPEDPGTPTNPTTPIEPGTSSNPGTPAESGMKSLPDTGEHNISGALAAMFAGLGGFLLFRKRKQENVQSEEK
ncbi:SdrD B-like domain-containing protein, partial [Macrococcus sp. DPC7161]|uniref:SdrD B-like domain-containing protein n=1 Tax=Macrococcus sp. DPC7161 TaxID=2507060 RepID=UPI00100C07FD